MTTRLYFPLSEAAAVSPAFNASWNTTGEAVRRRLARLLPDSALAAGTTIGPWTATANHSALDRQYVSDPLTGDFTISGTVSGVLRVTEIAAADNVDRLLIGIYVFSNDGSTLRGTLLAYGHYGTITTEFPVGSGTARIMANAQALTSVNALAGDRIVVEIGYTASGGAGAPTTPEARAVWGAVETLSDLALSNGGSHNENAWIEFSATIPVEPGVARVDVTQLEVARAVPFVTGAARIDTAYLEVIRSVVTPLSTRKRTRTVTVSVE